MFIRHDTDQVAVFLVDSLGYRIVLFQIGLSDRLDYTERNLIEKQFHTNSASTASIFW